MSKLWSKGYDVNKEIEEFTVGNDYVIDKRLVKYDCTASIAHAKMLCKIKIISKDELKKIISGLNEIISLDTGGKFEIKKDDEDCHTAIENYLTKKYGSAGKKIHTLRSRNDQVLTALRLYEKDELEKLQKLMNDFTCAIQTLVKKYGSVKMPGYTHMQKAMPTDVKTWISCFQYSMEDNHELLEETIEIIDKCPLGTAAGYGVPVFKIDRKMTSDELHFERVLENPMYAQMSRGKFEALIIHTLSQIMFDMNKLATDLITFSMNEFGYVELPKEFCTGSSIMPQKKNPDILELVRAKYHVVIAEQFKVQSLISNLISGYNRDLQLTKAPVFDSFDIAKSSLKIMTKVILGLKVNENSCKKAMTKELYATEEAYKLVKKGVPFREAYKRVGKKYS